MTVHNEMVPTQSAYVKLTDDEMAAILTDATPTENPEAKLAKHQADDAAAKKVQGLAP